MSKINIQFTLFSAFYTPLIVTMAGGFLQREGLEYEWSVSPPGVAAVDAVTAGTAQVVQSAPSQAFNAIARGETDYPLHFGPTPAGAWRRNAAGCGWLPVSQYRRPWPPSLQTC